MCKRDEAKAARRELGDAIGRFDLAVDTITPAPPAKPPAVTRAMAGIAEIYRGAVATVPLTNQRRKVSG